MSQQNPQDFMNQFNNMSENAQKMFEPWTKLNQAFLKNAEMMTEFSLNTIKSYSEMGLENMRQVSEIDSPESAENFSKKQAEMLNTISQKMLADAKRMTELGSSMHDEVMQVMGDVYGQTSEQMQSNMQKTADQATKAAQEYSANMNKMAEKATEQVSKATAAAKQTATKATEQANKNAKEYTENMKNMTQKVKEQATKATSAASKAQTNATSKTAAKTNTK
ncbi:phasin family protein [Psychrobacter sp. T6-1]|uniref:phasin family protein n=1 Tax=Psychrobacter sp. T6-1 TaxID=3457447 RepID=UPI003FD64962